MNSLSMSIRTRRAGFKLDRAQIWILMLLTPAAFKAAAPAAVSAAAGEGRTSSETVSSPGEVEARYSGRVTGEDAWTPAPTPLYGDGEGPCEAAIELILSPAMGNCLAVANDASSSLNLDAFYAMQSLTGYPGQIGDYDECAKVVLFDESIKPVMETHHCLTGSLSLITNDALVPFGGLCVPEACSPDALSTPNFRTWLVNKALEMEAAGTSTQAGQHYLYNLERHSQLAADLQQGLTCGTYRKPDYGWAAWCFTGSLCLLMVFILYASCLDLVNRTDDCSKSGEEKFASCRGGCAHRMKYAGLNLQQQNGKNGSDVYIIEEDHINKYLAAFSVPRNLSWLFSVGAANELAAFNGLRVLSVLWVLLGHILAVQSSIGYVNPETVMPPGGFLASGLGQLFFSARFSVDTFFFVSGFLVVYSMIRLFEHQGNGAKLRRVSSWLPLFYLHRFLRITPPYVFSLLVWWKLAVFLGQGPFWYRWEYFIGQCDRFWWANVLYANNFVPWHQGENAECFYVAWYLADDMQFYVVSPVFIVLYMNRKWWGVWATLVTILASSLAMAIGTYARGWSALTFDGSWVVKYSEETYTLPYFRIVSYLMGMLFAMLWHQSQTLVPHFKLANWQRYLVLFVSISLFVLVTFVGYSAYQLPPCSIHENPTDGRCGSGWSMGELALYNSGTRLAWGVALILLCFVCFSGQGGLIQQFLAHRAWAPLARLSFGAYLLHPSVINLWFLNTTAKFHFSKLDFFMSYVCVAGVSFGSALVMAMIVESPFAKLGRLLEQSLKPAPSVKASSEYFAAEQSPGVMAHRRDGMGDYLPRSDQEESGVLVATTQPARGTRTLGRHTRPSCPAGGVALSGRQGELAALVAHTNPGHHDYITEVSSERRGSEAFG